jgi:type VI secretion system protein ImpD
LGSPDDKPFGLLIGDYYVSHRPAADIETLRRLSKIAAVSFTPFITGVAPSLFGMDSFGELERSLNLDDLFQQTEYAAWDVRDSTEAADLDMPLHISRLRLQLLLEQDPLWQQASQSTGLAFHIGGLFPGLKLEFWAIKS